MMISDSDIIRRVQNGERELFGELHARYHDRVFRFVAQSVWQREAAEDVAGDVWLKAYRAVNSFVLREENSENGCVLAWILRIAANCVTDYRRKLKPQVGLGEEEEENILRLASPSAEGEAMRQEKIQAVRRALGRLSESDRRIIYLAHQNDLTCAQIAEVLQKPSISAVTSHLHRAMQHLRKSLQQSTWFGDMNEPNDSAVERQTPLRKISGA